MQNKPLKAASRNFEAHYINLEIERLASNIVALLKNQSNYWSNPIDTLDYSIFSKDGKIENRTSSENIEEPISLLKSETEYLTLKFANILKTSNLGLELGSDDYFIVAIDYVNHIFRFNVCVLGYQNVEAIFNIITEGIPLIQTNLPDRHHYIYQYLKSFYKDNPNFDKNIFLIMRFMDSPPFPEIIKSIEITCKNHDLNLVRADYKNYTDDLWDNILTYMYGCKYAIAIFDQINYREFNPNVAIEVGFMLAQTKRVLLLKDQSIPALPTDIVGKIYNSFNTYQPEQTIPPQLEKWFNDCDL